MMAGFFQGLGRFFGDKVRKAQWLVQSLTGTEHEAARAEQEVGRDLARAVREQFPPDPDPAVAQWLDAVGAMLVEAARVKDRTFVFRSVLSPEPNAFALPGGFIFATRSLLRLCQRSHDDLAFVLGHEIGHVLKGHAVERLVARSVIGTAGALFRGPAAGVLTSLLQQGYSQDQELEADRAAVELAARAGFDPSAGLRLLEHLRLLLIGPPGLAGYFSSHPPWDVRLEQLRRLVG